MKLKNRHPDMSFGFIATALGSAVAIWILIIGIMIHIPLMAGAGIIGFGGLFIYEWWPYE